MEGWDEHMTLWSAQWSFDISQVLSSDHGYLFVGPQDYEYASYNPIAFDIANHFCEMAANYHTETPHVLDYRKYPGSGCALHFE